MAYSAPGNVTSATGMFTYLNGVVDNWLFPGLILATYVIILIKMLTNPGNTVGKSFASASFICMIIAVFARILNFVDTTFMTLFIVLTAIGAVWMHFENN